MRIIIAAGFASWIALNLESSNIRTSPGVTLVVAILLFTLTLSAIEGVAIVAKLVSPI